MPRIPLCVPWLTGDDAAAVANALQDGHCSSNGPLVTKFEEEFAKAVGAKHAVACASGTAAIHLALMAIGVGPGDIVLCSDFTFIASANPARYCGATVEFIDSELSTWNMDPDLLEKAVAGRKIKAVILVHILGMRAQTEAIMAICDKHGIPVIEDAAEALGVDVGTSGVIGCFSFNGNKMITTGGGGMCVTADEKLASKMRHLSTQAKLQQPGYVHDAIGYNYRMTNMAAALGLSQLGRLSDITYHKWRIAIRYHSWSNAHGIDYAGKHFAGMCYWLTSLLFPGKRDAVLKSLTDADIESRPLWLPVSQQSCYRGSRRWGGEVSDRLSRDGLSLPSSATLTPEDQNRVIAAIERAL